MIKFSDFIDDAFRDTLIACGILKPEPHPTWTRSVELGTGLRLDAAGRRAAALEIWQAKQSVQTARWHS